jgi:hypothetical protein
MTVIDKAEQHAASETPQVTVGEAVACLLVAAIGVDGTVSPQEAIRIDGLFSTLPILRQAGNGSTNRMAERAIALLTDHGLPAILTGCAKVIPSALRATVFALATDLVLADGYSGHRERQFIDELQAVLQIDEPTALKIVEVMLIKNRG